MITRKKHIQSGERFGLLIVRGDSGQRTPKGGRLLACICDCGGTTLAVAARLRHGKCRSCGCLQKQTRDGRFRLAHGDSRGGQAPEYNSWCLMKSRCSNPKNNRYYTHGARGIKVCERWLHSYENFLSDMGRKPSRRHSIDRIDNEGNYEPGNCKWSTPSEQAFNRRPKRKAA